MPAPTAVTRGNGLPNITFEILDLPGNLLGLTRGRTVQIDTDAAGYGWFIGRSGGFTPFDVNGAMKSRKAENLNGAPSQRHPVSGERV
jgi:hypothetical protein